MMDDDMAAAAARQIFEAHVRFDRKLDKIEDLGTRLPRDRGVLLSLQARCMGEARKALEAGLHTEGRRLSGLARQLRQLAEGLQ